MNKTAKKKQETQAQNESAQSKRTLKEIEKAQQALIASRAEIVHDCAKYCKGIPPNCPIPNCAALTQYLSAKKQLEELEAKRVKATKSATL